MNANDHANTKAMQLNSTYRSFRHFFLRLALCAICCASLVSPAAIITMGETSVLATPDYGNGNLLVAQSATLTQAARIQSLSFYVTTTGGNLRLGIYDAAGPEGGPGAKVAETAQITPTVGWNTAVITTPALLPAGAYWLAYLPSSSALGFRTVNDSASKGRWYGFTYGAMPATFSTTPTAVTHRWSFYATLDTDTVPLDSVAPSVPAALTATAASATQVNLAWTGATDNIAVSAYQLERCQGAGCTAFVPVVSQAGLAFSDTNVVAAASYSYRVRATDLAGNAGGYSNVASVAVPSPDTTAPSAPALTAAAVNATQINLTWTAATDNVAVAGYQLERCQGSGCTSFAQVVTAAGVSFNDSGRSANTSYSYRVRATDAANNLGGYSNVVSAVTPVAPAIITMGETNILATGDGGNGNLLVAQSSVLTQTATLQSLSFYVTTAAGNLRLGVYDATGPDGGPGAKVAETGEITPLTGWNTVSVVTRVLLPAGVYWLAYLPSSNSLGFRNVNDSASSGKWYAFPYSAMPAAFSTTPTSGTYRWSLYATLDIATAVTDTTPPSNPGSLSATAISPSAINLSWTASTDNVRVTGYQLERCQGEGCANFALIAALDSLNYSDTSVAPATSYRYRLRSTDAAGNFSGYSEFVSGTTQALAPVVTLAAGPNTVSVGGSSVLNWSALNAVTCEGSGGWSGARSTSGSASTGSLGSNTTYTLTCTGAGGVTTVSATVLVTSSPQNYGLEWQGNGAVRRMLYWHNPFPIYDATYVFRVYPRKKSVPLSPTGYYTTFFWGNDGEFAWYDYNGQGGRIGNTYYGAHPYPVPAPNGPGQWEISVYSNDYVTGSQVQWDRWHTQAFRAWRESPSITHHEFYYDLPDITKVIRTTVTDPNWAKLNPPTPALVIGQAPNLNGQSWGGYPGWEEFNGIIRGIQIYSGLLSVNDILSEIAAPKSTAAGANLIWYLNLNPRPSDVSDQKGVGTPNNPTWDGATAFEWVE